VDGREEPNIRRGQDEKEGKSDTTLATCLSYSPDRSHHLQQVKAVIGHNHKTQNFPCVACQHCWHLRGRGS
jgi:hypothetical protein